MNTSYRFGRIIARCALMACVASMLMSAAADEAVWIGATNKGDWTDEANWKDGYVPEGDGSETIRFSEGKGTSVVIPEEVGPDGLGPYAYQLVFDASHNFAITAPSDSEGNVEFDIYGGGVSATTTNKCSYVVNLPTYFYNADTQMVHVGSSATLGFNRTVGFLGTTLHKTGPGTLRFSREMSGGTLLVSEGTATLYNASAVWTGDVLDVAGGTLEIKYVACIPTETVLSASGAGLISVKSGAIIDVSSLTLDGTPCAAGVWGGIGSGMPYESAHITGGYIRVNCFGDKGIWNWSTGRGTDPAAPAVWTDITNWKGAEAPGGEDAVARFDEPESALGPIYVRLPDTQLKLGELRANVEPVVFTNGNLYLGRTDTVSPQIWSTAGTRFFGDIEAKGAGVWWSTGSPDGSTNGSNRVSLRVNGDFELCGGLSLGTSNGRVLGVYDGTLMQRLDLAEDPESVANGTFAVYLSTRGGYGVTAPRGGLSSTISLDGIYCGTPTSSQRGIVLNKYAKGDNLVCVLKSGFAIDSGVNTAIKINTDPGYEPGLLLIAPAIDKTFAGPIVFNSDNVNVGFDSGDGRGYEQPTARLMFKGGSSGWKARVTMRDDGGSAAMRTIAVSNWTGTIVKDGPNRFSSRAMETPGAAAGAVVEEGDWEMLGAGAKESIFATLAISNGARLVAAHGLRFGAASFRPEGTLQLAGRSTFTGTFAPARLEADIAPTLAGLGRIDVAGTLDLSRGGTITITGYEEDLAPGTYVIATGTTVTGGGAWTVIPPEGSDFAYSVSTDGGLAVTVARKDLTISSSTALATVKYARNVTLATTPGATNRVTGRNVRGFIRRGIDARLYTRCHHNSIKMYSKESSAYNKSWSSVQSSFALNNSFWAKDADLSSYSIWNYAGGCKKPATLLSRRHVAFANHYAPGSSGSPANTQVTFLGTNGVYYTYQTVGIRNIECGDVAMAGLTEEVNENVVPGRILPGDWDELLGGSEGLPVATFDQLDHLSVHTLVSGFTAGYPDEGRRHDYTEYIYQGDSGHPRYMLCGNESINICHLTSGVTGSGISRHVMTNELQAAMDAISDACKIPRRTLGRFDFTPYFGRLDAEKLTVSGGGTARLEAKLASVPDLELDNATLTLTATGTVSFGALVAKGATCRLVVPVGTAVSFASQSVAPGTDFKVVKDGRDPSVPETMTWVGPSVGGVWSDPLNWEGTSSTHVLPLSNDTVVFPSATTNVTLDAAAEVSGLTLNGALTLNGTAALTVGTGGITASAQENTIKTPIALNGSQTWNVAASGNLIVEGVISGGASTETLTKGTGTGSLTLKGVNTFESIFAISAGYVYLYDDATLGANDVGKVTINESAGARLYLSNATANRNVETTCSNNTGGDGALRAVADTTNLVNGAVKLMSGSLVFYAEKGSQLVIAGGVSASSKNVNMCGNGGEIVVSNKIITCNTLYCPPNSTYPATVRFKVPNNAVSSFYMRRGANGMEYVHFDVDDVFKNTTKFESQVENNGFGAYLNLHGTTQHFSSLIGNANYKSKAAYITSAEPGAALHFNQTTDSTHYWQVQGNVSLFKSGDKQLTFAKSGTTTGTLGVSAGTLEIASGVTYSNVTNINVSSSGMFKTNKAGAFSRDCDVTLDGASAKLNLNFKGTNECGRLYMRNDNNVLKPVKAGVYGATGSGAPNELANITGTGFLRVSKARGGTLFVLR